MPDLMDAVQDRMLREQDEILQHARKPGGAGRTHCARQDCGEAIAPQRTRLGASLCMECQQEQDARDAHFRHWSRR